jgi:predicted Zn finger-like uncharacterized protein
MIAGCPKCSARYRVDLDQIGTDGAKLRCTKCSAVFLVRAPQSTPPAAAAAAVAEPAASPDAQPGPTPSAQAAPETTSPTHSRPPVPEPPIDVDPSTLVLIADSSEERGKRVASAVESWGLSPILVHDGVEAMLAIQRQMPQVVVLDAALPKMFGFQVCEIVKRNESLRYMNVVLIGAIHHQDRYRRNPAELYGADVYLEQPDLPDGLLPLLRNAGMSVRDAATTNSATPATGVVVAEAPTVIEGMEARGRVESTQPSPVAEPTPTAARQPTPVAAPRPGPAPAANSELDAERERAERLARIAVSEMLLYQPEKFDQAIRDGNIEAVLDLEIQEARALIRQRIGEEVRAEKDFILVELERVAQERSTAS